jgi:glutamate-1-semialdehyde aminotransferase
VRIPNTAHEYKRTVGAKKADTKKVSRFFWETMDHGFYPPCDHSEVAFPSVLHTHERVNETIAAAREAIAGVE